MFAAGQVWTYRTPPGSEASRMVVGAVLAFAEPPAIVCCAVLGAPQRMPDGTVSRITIPFLPMTQPALAASVIALEGSGEPPAAFAAQFAAWRSEARGLAYFTVPFEGHLDQMIARQMAEIAGVDPGGAG
ncbi:MAG TPA: hypothetical protein PK264_17995 [Hyphomicrobiaceae bacterium]|nr:hypothetical protein [Hyphomicrobiaceae bacterium]